MERKDPIDPQVAKILKSEAVFPLLHIDASRALFHGKLLKRTEKNPDKKRDWGNVAEHCIDVARYLNELAELLGLSKDDHERIVKVGMMHDWDTRLLKQSKGFTDEERAEAHAYAQGILSQYDPEGYLLASTKPEGLDRMETDAATELEHCVHFIDLSTMDRGLVPPEDRIVNDLMKRKKDLIDHPVYGRFWDRKLALVKKEEADMLAKIRANGTDVPEGARVCDLIKERLSK